MKYLFLFAFVFAVSDIHGQKTKKALFVIVDGIPADVIEATNAPALDEIANVGGYARASVGGDRDGYSCTPTISAVGYNSLLTGTWANKHNVWNNRIEEPNYSYQTIFRLFSDQYPDRKTAIFSTWKDNRTKLIGEGLPETGRLQLDHHFDGLELDTITYPHDGESDYIHRIDEAVIDNASEYLIKEAPDLSWVYLQYTDDMGHKYGDGEKFYQSVAIMDKQVGRLWKSVLYRMEHFNEDWVIYVTTDHGRDSVTGRGHGGQTDRERSIWIVTNAENLNSYFKSGKAMIVDIFLSIANFMNITPSRTQLMELDGVPLTGKVYATAPQAIFKNGRLTVSWEVTGEQGNARIWVATTNHFKTGGTDDYRLMTTIPLYDRKAELDVSDMPSDFYKVVIETPGHMLNRWVLVEESL